jgi:hypothetical protein
LRAVESYCRSASLQQATAFVHDKPKILWRLNELPSVTVIVLSSALGKETAERARRVSRRTECADAEVICPAIDTPAGLDDGVKFVAMASGADIVDQTNRLVSSSAGEILVFVDASIQLEAGNWMQEIVGPLLLPGVGLCGCHLAQDRSGEVRHVGIAFDDDGNAWPVRPTAAQAEFVLGWEKWLHNWSAASGACFAIRRSAWDDVGGLSSPNGHSRPDIRLCLKLAEKGMRVATSPAALVRQTGTAVLEIPVRTQGEEDRRIVRGVFPHGDPHINPNLSLDRGILVPR